MNSVWGSNTNISRRVTEDEVATRPEMYRELIYESRVSETGDHYGVAQAGRGQAEEKHRMKVGQLKPGTGYLIRLYVDGVSKRGMISQEEAKGFVAQDDRVDLYFFVARSSIISFSRSSCNPFS